MNKTLIQTKRLSLWAVSALVWVYVGWAWPTDQYVSRTEDDNKALQPFEHHLGEWGPPPDDLKHQGNSIVYEWGLKGKTVKLSEYRTIDGKKTKVAEGLIGYHYQSKQIVYQQFVLDGTRPFEVMCTGRYWFEDGRVMKREFKAFDPDTTSRTYRETFTPVDEKTRKLLIEYLDDNGQWKTFGEFTLVRKPTSDTPLSSKRRTSLTARYGGSWRNTSS